jgi:Chromosome segregation protein Spc25
VALQCFRAAIRFLLSVLTQSFRCFVLFRSFAFTLLDENSPDRRFEFTLATTDDGESGEEGGSYELVECDPVLRHREDELNALVKALNETDDMSDFVRTLRQMFAEALAAANEERRKR